MAGRLVLEFEGRRLLERDLDKESVLIGRRPTSDLHIDDRAVSGTHARVLTILDDSFLEDMNSTNGVFVNGRRVRKHPLRHGDVVTVGRHRLRFEAPGRGQRDERPSVGAALDPGAAGHAPGAAAGAPGAAAAVGAGPGEDGVGLGPARLCVVDPGGGARTVELTRAVTRIGKPGVLVAAISRRADGDFLVHVEGADDAGTPRVNGESIGYRSRRLEHEDEIEIAGVHMRYRRG